jgi:hypothetical protein
VDRRLDELSEFRKELKRMLADWDARLASLRRRTRTPPRISRLEARRSAVASARGRIRKSPKEKGRLMRRTVAALSIAAASFAASAALAQDCHHAKVAERGDHVMGFDHTKTTHHFRLLPAGGAIEVSANDAADTESRDAIRGHLSHIATMFRGRRLRCAGCSFTTAFPRASRR